MFEKIQSKRRVRKQMRLIQWYGEQVAIKQEQPAEPAKTPA